MGRRSRIVNRALLDAYGPLDCGLRLSGDSAGLNQLRLMLRHVGQRLQHIKSLQLPRPLDGERSAYLLSAAVSKLPNLTSMAAFLRPSELPLLAPLRHTLTALDLAMQPSAGHDAAAIRGLARLTNLRSLSLSHAYLHGGSSDVGPPHAAGSVPQRTDMSSFVQSSPRWLARVRGSMPHLTSLSLALSPPPMGGWHDDDMDAVQAALAGVRSLSLDAGLMPVSMFNSLVLGLAQCTEIESLHLGLHLSVDPWTHLAQLSTLQLDSLDVGLIYPSSSTQDPLAPALRTQSRLTRLSLHCTPQFELLTPHLPSRLPSSLVELHLNGRCLASRCWGCAFTTGCTPTRPGPSKPSRSCSTSPSCTPWHYRCSRCRQAGSW
jgi:hypothetical protein